jgi:bifunctional non-homologous end joining protein LigD
MADKLSTYRRKRSADRTPEPIPAVVEEADGGSSFVVQEHHARALHWDFRLERDGVLVSWAVPKGLPMDPKVNRLAVQTEDHPLEYAEFAGGIPHGEYGGGTVTIWDQGSYECEKWNEREVMVVLHGRRVQGRYVLIHTGGRNWLLHRMEPAAPGRVPLPPSLEPMLATPGRLPPSTKDDEYGYEPRWDGVRLICTVDGGRIRFSTGTFGELFPLGASLGTVAAVLDGTIDAPPERLAAPAGAQRRLADEAPAHYHLFDLLHLDGHDVTGLPYRQRQELLASLELSGPAWSTVAYQVGGGARALAQARAQGRPGVLAKRLDSVYEPGRRSAAWIEVSGRG